MEESTPTPVGPWLGPTRNRDRYKRSDLPTPVVLAMIAVYGMRAWECLTERYPWKIVWRAYQRDIGDGYLECGTSEARPWITDEGERYIRHEKMKVVGCGDYYPPGGSKRR